MTRAELKPIYVEAAARARTKPQRSEEDVWLKTLEYAHPHDLKAAIDTHFQRSHWMPKESELRPLVEQARSSREVRNSAETLLARWECGECRATRCGFIPPSDHQPRRCFGIPRKGVYEYGELCGAAMREIVRMVYRSDRQQRVA
jgi:hypothetical protein